MIESPRSQPRSGRRRKAPDRKTDVEISEKLLDQRPESTAADKVQARLTSRSLGRVDHEGHQKVHQNIKLIKNI